MKPDEIKQEIEQLELADKLHLVEDIWDSIAATNDVLPLADWQRKELGERYDEYSAGKVELHEWQGVHEGLRVK